MVIENPSQREVSHAHPFGDHSPNFVDRIQRRLKINPRERFPTIESLAVSIKIPVIVRGECGVASDFPAEQTAGERESNENPNVALLCSREKQVLGSLPENIENDLNRGDPGEFDCFQSFLNLFHADTVVKNFTGFL